MARVRLSTTIDEDLLMKVKDAVQAMSLDGANDVIEDALRIYFANCTTEVWEKQVSGGWVKKMVVRPDRVTLEAIRFRKVKFKYDPKQLTPLALEEKGWRQVWKMRHA